MARFKKLILLLDLCFCSIRFMILSPAFCANSIQQNNVFFQLSKSCWVGLTVLAVGLVLSLFVVWPHPNLNTLCVQHLDAYSLSKKYKKYICSEKHKTQMLLAKLVLFLLEVLKCFFSNSDAIFTPLYIITVFYYFLLVWITFLS